MVPQLRPQLRDWQEKLYAENKQSLLIVCRPWMWRQRRLIKHVMASVNPQGYMWHLKQPSLEELIGIICGGSIEPCRGEVKSVYLTAPITKMSLSPEFTISFQMKIFRQVS